MRAWLIFHFIDTVEGTDLKTLKSKKDFQGWKAKGFPHHKEFMNEIFLELTEK
jgi:hypothetical protein